MEREGDRGRGESHGMWRSEGKAPAGKDRVILGWLKDTSCPGNKRKGIKAGWVRKGSMWQDLELRIPWQSTPTPPDSITSVLTVPTSLIWLSPENWALCHKLPRDKNISIGNLQVWTDRSLLKTSKVCWRCDVLLAVTLNLRTSHLGNICIFKFSLCPEYKKCSWEISAFELKLRWK